MLVLAALKPGVYPDLKANVILLRGSQQNPVALFMGGAELLSEAPCFHQLLMPVFKDFVILAPLSFDSLSVW